MVSTCTDDTGVAAQLIAHRVGGRVLASAAIGAGPDLSAETLEALKVEQLEIESAFAADAAALRRLSAAHLDPRAPAVLLKGHAAHLTLGTRRSLRRTLDIDLVCARPEPLLQAVRRGEAESYRNPSPHELANARFFGRDVDLHAHYPIWDFAPSRPTWTVAVEDGLVACHAGRLAVSPLEPARLLADALPVPALGAPYVRVPDPAASILVLAAHGYRNAVSRSSVSVREKPPVRLVELVEIRDLLDHPGFDRDRLAALASALDAGRTLALAGGLVDAVLDDDRLAALAASLGSGSDRLPVSVWGGIWIDPAYDARALLDRHASTEAVANALGAARLRRDHGAAVRLAPRSEGGDLLADGATLHVLGDPAAIDLARGTIVRTATTLTVELETRARTEAPNRRVALDVGGFALEINWNVPTGALTTKHSDRPITPVVASRRDGARHVLRVDLDVRQDPALRADPLPILVGVGEFERIHAMRAGLLIPLVLGTTEGDRHAG
ncbi:nucleotidyltransferase family protein [Salinarimonas chemoclinalis]|uniref:nucleotidyltransferase family protein n=1 Tax=Salinarimonas chemoclinalis TaxID=3241599 RepID=UPI003557B73C